MNQIANWLGADRYLPHAYCLTGEQWLVTVYMACHFVTGWAYVTIWWVWTRTGYNPFARRNRRVLSALFVLLCGVQHFTMGATYVWGIYRLDVLAVAAMAAVSATVAVISIRDAYGEG
jgi:hypothetical protein